MANGFYTVKKGKGKLEVVLNFPIYNGAYPFQEFDSSLTPVPIRTVDMDDLRVISIVSHCKDNRGHGLVADTASAPDEDWFDVEGNPYK